MAIKDMSTGKLEKVLSTWRTKKEVCPAKEPLRDDDRNKLGFYCGVQQSIHNKFDCAYFGDVVGKRNSFPIYECKYKPERLRV